LRHIGGSVFADNARRLAASPHAVHRAKALAEQAVRESELDWTVLAPSIVYAPGDAWLTLLERLSLLPVMPISGMGQAPPAPQGTDR
jgi:uncharacterized protein YbjT (DUF2867 family)